jgi:hypothetical protein
MPVKKSTAAPRSGAPKRTPQSAPKAAPLSTVSTASSKVKRNVVDDTKKNKVYTIKKGGGIWYKLKQNNITVFDEETATVRMLRYSPNENSVWADEQGENIIREQIVFTSKNLVVPYTNPPLQKYLSLHPDNIANGGTVFYLVDTEKNAEVELDREFSMLEAVAMVRDKSIDELVPVAMYLGINTDQKNMEIKRELLREAKSNPTRFIEMFDNPVVRTKSVIMSAIDFQILKADSDGLKWFDSNRLIVATPVGQDTIDISTRFCLSEKGALVFEEIQTQLDKI